MTVFFTLLHHSPLIPKSANVKRVVVLALGQNLFSSYGNCINTEERISKLCEEIILVVVFPLEAELMLLDLCRAKALIFFKGLCVVGLSCLYCLLFLARKLAWISFLSQM